MNKFRNKLFSITIILIVFMLFVTFETTRKSEKSILRIITPTLIEIDLNNNKNFDTGETICIPDIQTFTSNLSITQTDLEKDFQISYQDGIKLGYLTDELAEKILSDKKVKVKFTEKQDQNCKYANIIVNNKSYRETLLNSGLGFAEHKPSENFQKQLEKARKLKLVIYNHKSGKYHNLECKYGQIAQDKIILPKRQLPSNSSPCKFCHITKKSLQKNATTTIPYPLTISNGSIKMFLTDLTTKLKPDNKCSSLVCKEILKQINTAQSTIDIALYGYDNIPEIHNALLKAKAKGIKIRIVYDKNNYYPQTQDIINLADQSSTDTPKIIMHNKFIIFDNKSVITGSMNFSQTGLSGFNSNCIFLINSKEIAQIYQEEFTQMLNGKFHNQKNPVTHKTINLGSSTITPLFSPKDKIITKSIIPLIDSSKKYIYIPAFLLTHDELSASLVKAKNRGVDVKLIIDATNPVNSRSKVKYLRQANIPVKVENYAGKLHSKSIIIDDKYIISGSMNFSNSGENKNDENCLIIIDTRLARYYRGFFEYLWAKIPDKYSKINPNPESKNSIGSCTDGIDNDFDGKIDTQDTGCQN